MPDPEGTVICDFRNAYGEPIEANAKFLFKNLTAHSMTFEHETELTGEPKRLTGVPAFPFGHWQVDINIERFRFKSLFVDVPSNGEVELGGNEPAHKTFFVRPSEASPIFPSADDIQNLPRWDALRGALAESPLSYNALEDQQKAGLLNLFAKMSDASTQNVFGDVTKIFKVKPARIFAEVKPALWDRVRDLTQLFGEQHDGGSLHTFDNPWARLNAHASFKTSEDKGNLQLTFAQNADEDFAVDADLDDNQGIKHAFDVVKHKFSGDTNPYDIHEVLVRFHDIDPGYRLY